MSSVPFRSSSIVGVIAFALCAAMLAPSASRADDSAKLSAAVKAALVQAPSGFPAWRGPVKASDKDGVTYAPTASMKLACPLCTLTDEYADANTDERYAITFNWLVPKSWSRAQILAYIQLNVGALAPSFDASQGTNDEGDNWFDWSKGSPKEFVYVETFSDKTQTGFQVRVGRYLKKNLHYVPYAILSPTQRDDLAKAIRNFVQVGVADASDNFNSMRGTVSGTDNAYFDANISFGEFLTGCNIDGIPSDAKNSITGKWVLECDTPSLGGAKSDVEEIIRSAAYAALPGGFTPTTDPTYLLLSDYRWDRSSDSVAVEVSSNDNGDGTLGYTVEVYHFLP